MTTQREDADRGRADECGGQAMKRRGLIAGAAALVAAMVAKQTSAPVAALDPNDLALGTANSETNNTLLLYSGATLGDHTAALAVADSLTSGHFTAMVAGIATGGKAGTGVYGESGGAGDGVHGVTSSGSGVRGDSTSGWGVEASSTSNDGINAIGGKNGIFGYTIAIGGGAAGVYGNGNGSGTFGVFGFGGGSSGVGVEGQSDAAGGVGVQGVSASGFPIIGNVTGTGSATNTAAGVLGAGTKGPGVQGQSTNGHGLVGTTNDGNGHAGLIGNATTTGGIGLMGIAPNYGMPTVGLAGDFFGNVKINGGNLLAPVMQAAVKHQGDGSYRALHTLTTPEGWVEDFGTGTLAADTAQVTLDHDFAALIQPDYHVFLTARGPLHLYVEQQTAGGFTVIATPLGSAGGPKRAVGGGSFSWRVVGKRKDVSGERLAKVAAPSAPKVPAAFTIPETPASTPPEKP